MKIFFSCTYYSTGFFDLQGRFLFNKHEQSKKKDVQFMQYQQTERQSTAYVSRGWTFTKKCQK
jgi:hypothetical protein